MKSQYDENGKFSFKKYYSKNKQIIIERSRKYRKDYPLTELKRSKANQNSKKYYQENKQSQKKKISQLVRKKNKQRRILVINHYTNGKNCCQCPGCSEKNFNFLTVDHVNNDGNIHRSKMRKNIYRWLVANNFPPGFQILCWNCNMGKAHNHDICPHFSSNS